MSEQNLTTLNRLEAKTLQDFIYQVDSWQARHGDKANTIEIVYYPEDEGFEVANGEENNGILRRNRATLFRTDILAWGANQLRGLEGWNNDKTVTAFTCVYKDGEFGIKVAVQDSIETETGHGAIEFDEGSGAIGD
ncbi:hypothetical protein LU290_03495 [Moraxella nasibovis]|uniref:hypothetical protein n=1 Tax=Moraxella nasibovis TaxID=2904120 RepID=UPI00240F7245|nr:hypothetical protein [Moraxella nasibovis]WFF39300.1 hypothetical protein LU290_03495 [Moraxella nasibovis]